MKIKIAIVFFSLFGQSVFAQKFTRAELYDKVLGSLVGSAIGDAMGAPTEMWQREDIIKKFGYVYQLDTVIRATSPEGVWIADLPPGGTTDDTRWKKLAINFLIQQSPNKKLSPKKFAKHILKQYESYQTEQPIDSLKLDWLVEWAKIAKPFVKKDYLPYQQNLIKFYGGDLACGGLLYSPMIGTYYPGDPLKAYNEAYQLALWDQGYARDLTAIAAAMVASAMDKNPTKENILAVFDTIDPQGFQQSRLVGRLAKGLLAKAQSIVNRANETDLSGELNPQKIYRIKQEAAIKLLHEYNQDIPFHAGEIMLQVVTAMLFADFDFEKSIVFLVNNARDNDTNSAITGSILGAMVGFEKLPSKMKNQVLSVNKSRLGNDLELMANQLVERILERK
ncbi:MAG: ADP-ribosylglycohydrolase family protein [Bacteroidota bacterium]